METSKQVRVDNWGIYFLQRLQLFFSKTDYCDLTLQFEGNVQLKVHRLVMNACTEYFAFLEQKCPAPEENTIMMPADLQADVIVPIVNFMYTGMLEFHPRMYDRLYRAAEIMNISVLTKLLEAQLPPATKMDQVKKENITSWKYTMKKWPKTSPPIAHDAPAASPVKKVPTWKKRQSEVSQPNSSFNTSKWSSERETFTTSSKSQDNTPKPTRFEWPEEDATPMSLYHSFDDVSLTSKPLWTKDDDQKAVTYERKNRQRNSTSQAESDEELCEKEVKPAHKEPEVFNKRKAETKLSTSPKRIKITNQDDETIISITTNNPNEVDHTKIVSEVLRKYPDLVKKKRNIKLKITATSEPSSDKPPAIKTPNSKLKNATKKSQVETNSTVKEIKRESPARIDSDAIKDDDVVQCQKVRPNFRAASEEGPWTCLECQDQEKGPEYALYYLFRKHMTDQHHVEFDATLCKYCGKKCSKPNHMIYHLYTKHDLKPPKNVTFPQCDRCPFIAVSTERLEEHVKTHGDHEVQCSNCYLGFFTKRDLIAHHQMASHSNRNTSILDCAYCLKKLQNPVTMFTHVRVQHMKEARRDGVTSLDEIMDIQAEGDAYGIKDEIAGTTKVAQDKVKILSNVAVPGEHSENKNATDTVAVTTAAALGNISGSLAANLGLVDIVVLDDNQQYILQQPQTSGSNAEFILPTELTNSEGILQAVSASGELNSTDELVMVLTDQDYQDEQTQGQEDNSNIVVLYSHPVEGQQRQFITSQGNLVMSPSSVLGLRNGAATTTADDASSVNTDAVTTQAEGAHIESIDMIRKEIEGVTNGVSEESSKEKVKDDDSNQENRVEAEIKSQDTDTTDSVMQRDESMEVDDTAELSTIEAKHDTEPTTKTVESDPVKSPPTADDTQNIEQLVFPEQDNVGHDVPPNDASLTLSQDSENLEGNLVLNDPLSFPCLSEEVEESQQSTETAGDEPMEVDGAIKDQSTDDVVALNSDNILEETRFSKDEEVNVKGNANQSQNSQKELDKTILDDWEDTDSQQSQPVAETEDGAPVKEGANVNKLMDDWEEEEEEQNKS